MKDKASEHRELNPNLELLANYVKSYRLEGVRSMDIVSKDRSIHGQKCIQILLDMSLRKEFPDYEAFISQETETEHISIQHSHALQNLKKLFDEQCTRLVQNKTMDDLQKIKIFVGFFRSILREHPLLRTLTLKDDHKKFIQSILSNIEEIVYISFLKAYVGRKQDLILTKDEKKILRTLDFSISEEDHQESLDPEIYVFFLLLLGVLKGERTQLSKLSDRITTEITADGTSTLLDMAAGRSIDRIDAVLQREKALTNTILRLRTECTVKYAPNEEIHQRENHTEVHNAYLHEWTTLNKSTLLSIHDFTFTLPESSFPLCRIEVVNPNALCSESMEEYNQDSFDTIRWIFLTDAPMTSVKFTVSIDTGVCTRSETPSFSIDLGDAFLGYIFVLDLETGMLNCIESSLQKGKHVPYITHPAHFFSIFEGGRDYITSLEINLLEQIKQYARSNEKNIQEDTYESEPVLSEQDDYSEYALQQQGEYSLKESLQEEASPKILLTENALLHVDKSLYELVPIEKEQEHAGYILTIVERIADQYEVPHGYTLRKCPKYMKALGWKQVRNILRDDFNCIIKKSTGGTHFKAIRHHNGSVRTTTILAPDNTYYAKRAKYGTLKSVLSDLHIPEIVFWRAAAGKKEKEQIINHTTSHIEGIVNESIEHP